MRITQNSLFNTLHRQLVNNADSLMKAQEQVATGKRINRLSDDAVAGGRVLDVKKAIGQGEQYRRNIDQATNLSNTYEQTLETGVELVQRAKELLLREANEVSSTASSREATRTEISLVLNQLVQVANTKFNGEYIYAGYQSNKPAFANADPVVTPATVTGGATVNGARVTDVSRLTYQDYQIRFTAPDRYEVVDAASGAVVKAESAYASGEPIRFDGLEITISDDSGAPAAGDVFSVATSRPGSFQGDGGLREVEVQPGQKVPQTLTGETVFGAAGPEGVDIFNTLNSINDALRTNDREEIDRLLGELDSSHSQLTNVRTQVGGRLNLLEQANERHLEIESNLEIMRSELEDVDLAEAITELTRQENIYQATIQSGAKIIQPSLLDFLR